jgi:hypothetical protein
MFFSKNKTFMNRKAVSYNLRYYNYFLYISNNSGRKTVYNELIYVEQQYKGCWRKTVYNELIYVEQQYKGCFFTISLIAVMVFNATFNNISVISWRSVLLVTETGENHLPVTSHSPTLSHNVLHFSVVSSVGKSNAKFQPYSFLLIYTYANNNFILLTNVTKITTF